MFRQNKQSSDPTGDAGQEIQKGMAAWQAKEYRKAIKCFDRALTLDSNRPDALSNKGLCHAECNEIQVAISCYHKCLEINPQWGLGWYNLGNSLEKQNDCDKAIEAFSKAVNATDGIDDHFRVRALTNKGLLEYKAKRYEAAIKTLRGAVKKDPNLTLAKALLGMSLMVSGGDPEEVKTLVNAIHDGEYQGLWHVGPDGVTTVAILHNGEPMGAVWKIKPNGNS